MSHPVPSRWLLRPRMRVGVNRFQATGAHVGVDFRRDDARGSSNTRVANFQDRFSFFPLSRLGTAV